MQIAAEMSSKWDKEYNKDNAVVKQNAIQVTMRNEGLLWTTKKNNKEKKLDVLYSIEARMNKESSRNEAQQEYIYYCGKVTGSMHINAIPGVSRIS
ncbi:hypothetical protein N7508_010327 [Penicillium antarcticum]|uniref:uncharacterized protein n=1 Tax=Penicillium antarcticum TaxID=416450 RepID=UPI0023A03E25|nr:uncharacterized protein N7508_010327 [Penicillium antarcticum]KAJ5295506.1 hypothetical protein N7508_010327 [Penicillium antarcticum]